MSLEQQINDGVLYAFKTLTPNIAEIYSSSATLDIDKYIEDKALLVAGLGAGTAAIPGMHLAGMAADIAGLFKILCDTSYGIGSIIFHENNISQDALTELDFLAILAYWGGNQETIDTFDVAVSSASVAGVAIGSQVAQHLAISYLPQPAVALLGKIITKKIGLKFAGKGLAGFIPFLGPAISAGINLWLFTSITDEAKIYYEKKLNSIILEK